MKYTGVKITDEEKNELTRLLIEANSTPVIYFGPGKSAADYAHERLSKRVHEIALSHGLPEIQGYYGCDLKESEIVVMKELLIKIERKSTEVRIHIRADGVLFHETHNFCSVAYAEGMMSDIFHELTGNRHKEPSPRFEPKKCVHGGDLGEHIRGEHEISVP